MSRKGKLPIPIPSGVEVKVIGDEVHVKGPKGNLQRKLMPGILIELKDQHVHVAIDENRTDLNNFHGLYRALIANMVEGVHKHFEKKLEMIGVGYRASVQGQLLDLQIGLSHPTKLPIPKGLAVKVEKNTQISISGADKQEVGEFAATVRSKKPPEPYQGKGIRYEKEYVRKKAGKAAAKK